MILILHPVFLWISIDFILSYLGIIISHQQHRTRLCLTHWFLVANHRFAFQLHLISVEYIFFTVFTHVHRTPFNPKGRMHIVVNNCLCLNDGVVPIFHKKIRQTYNSVLDLSKTELLYKYTRKIFFPEPVVFCRTILWWQSMYWLWNRPFKSNLLSPHSS